MAIIQCVITECIYNNNKICSRDTINIGFIPYEGIECYSLKFNIKEIEANELNDAKQDEFSHQLKYR